jgi:hypothetical protein
MSRSDSKIDLAKYKPSIEDARRIASEDAAEDRMRKALDNPALDAALEELHSPPAPGEPDASPWAKGSPRAGAIDKAALPSSGAPAPPVTAAIKAAGHVQRTGAWTPARKTLAAIALAFLPAMVVFVLFVKPPQGTTAAPSASASPPASAPKASASTPEAASPSASVAPSAEPIATAVPSAATVGATVQPAPAPTTLAPRKPKSRGALDDPYDAAAPGPAETAQPQPTAAPSAPPAPPSTAPTVTPAAPQVTAVVPKAPPTPSSAHPPPPATSGPILGGSE